MKGFLEEYGLIIVVVAVILLMLLFGKSGYAKSIQDAILGSADHIVETGENIVPKPAKASDTIEIEGTKYIVLEERENNQALIMTASSIGDRAFQSNYNWQTDLRPDGQNMNIYEGSEIDNYLENEWYNGLSIKMKASIQTTSIKQAAYETYYNTNEPTSQINKYEKGYNNQVYNTISRHVFLPSVSEIGKVVDVESVDKVKAFLNRNSIWTRDCSPNNRYNVGYLFTGYGILDYQSAHRRDGVRPTFVIDLSKVDYKVTGHTDYK